MVCVFGLNFPRANQESGGQVKYSPGDEQANIGTHMPHDSMKKRFGLKKNFFGGT